MSGSGGATEIWMFSRAGETRHHYSRLCSSNRRGHRSEHRQIKARRPCETQVFYERSCSCLIIIISSSHLYGQADAAREAAPHYQLPDLGPWEGRKQL
jgi:hypothetical protein